MDLSNSDIIHEIVMGNRKVFEQVFKEYFPLLIYEARGYIYSYDLADEIVCDVFTRIWVNREKLEIKTSLRDYLIKAVHNTSIDYYRQLKRKETLFSDSDKAEQAKYTLKDLNQSPLDYMLTKELEEKINHAIAALPPQYRRTFILSRFKGLSYENIAREMNLSVNTVKTNIKNALSILRNELKSIVLLLMFFTR